MNKSLDAEDALLAEVVTSEAAGGVDSDGSLVSGTTASDSGHGVNREVQVVAALARAFRSRSVQQHLAVSVRPAHAVAEPVAAVPIHNVPSDSTESWGSFRILGEVGRGSFGRVFRAWEPRLEREVALKLFDAVPAAREGTLVAEARRLAQIRHENVVTVLGADQCGSAVGFWMEFINGRTLKMMQDDYGPFSAQEALLIAEDVCRALAAVHRSGFVHGDVKAQNVIRQVGGRIVLTDFGAARLVTMAADDRRRTTVTPLYAAPEVLLGAAPTVKSDLYSLGVLLYYLVTGKFPVNGESIDDFRLAHVSGRRTLLRDVRPDLPAAFIRVVDEATGMLPEERPDSAGALEALIDNAAGRVCTNQRAGSRNDAPVGRPAGFDPRAAAPYLKGLYCWN